MVNQILQQRRVEDGRGLKFLSGDRGANDSENSGADHRADAKRGEAEPAQGFFQPEFGAFTMGNEMREECTARGGDGATSGKSGLRASFREAEFQALAAFATRFVLLRNFN